LQSALRGSRGKKKKQQSKIKGKKGRFRGTMKEDHFFKIPLTWHGGARGGGKRERGMGEERSKPGNGKGAKVDWRRCAGLKRSLSGGNLQERRGREGGGEGGGDGEA